MKKTYYSPTLEVIRIDAQQMLASSDTQSINLNSTGDAVDASNAAGHGTNGDWE